MIARNADRRSPNGSAAASDTARTLDWSYELLPEPERLVLRRLAAFVGDFTAAAASLVAAGGEIAHRRCPLPGELVTKSLVTVEVGSVTAYYRLHETTRGYALEKLAEAASSNWCTTPCQLLPDLFDRAETELETLPAPAWLAATPSRRQVRAALDWAFSPTGAAEVGVALTVAAVPLWVHLSLMEECRGRVERRFPAPPRAETHVETCNYMLRLARCYF